MSDHGPLLQMEIKHGRDIVGLQRIEAGELLAACASVPMGSVFFKLTLNGKMQRFCQDADQVRSSFLELQRSIGIRTPHAAPFLFCDMEAAR